MKSEGVNEANNTVLEGLMERRTVLLEGDITPESGGEVANRLLRLQMISSKKINLIINSFGGNTYAALRLCDMMSTVLTAPIRGIAHGRCGSAATFVLLHCSERVSTPYTRFLIHSSNMNQISISVNQSTLQNLEDLLKEAKATENLVIQMYMRKLGKTATQVKKLIARGDQRFNDVLSAEEAKKINLITHIVRGSLGIFA